jgi:flagellar basal-body rod protein FlgB
MDLSLTVLRLASDLAAHAKTRQSVIAENVAHADTPGYRARDIADFASVVEQAGPAFAARTTRPGHVAFGADARGFEPRETTAFGAESPNGNTVSLEDQMMRAADVRASHDLALGVYGKSLDILRAGLGRGR